MDIGQYHEIYFTDIYSSVHITHLSCPMNRDIIYVHDLDFPKIFKLWVWKSPDAVPFIHIWSFKPDWGNWTILTPWCVNRLHGVPSTAESDSAVSWLIPGCVEHRGVWLCGELQYLTPGCVELRGVCLCSELIESRFCRAPQSLPLWWVDWL